MKTKIFNLIILDESGSMQRSSGLLLTVSTNIIIVVV